MIKKFPKSVEFENVAKQCLHQAFISVYKVHGELRGIRVKGVDETDVSDASHWEYHTAVTRTALILAYQGVENYMKATICNESPFLLLDMERSEWPTMPTSKDLDFDEMHMLSGKALLTTFFTINPGEKFGASFAEWFDTLRVIRNRAMHSSLNLKVTAKTILSVLLEAFYLFEGPGTWFQSLKENRYINPLFGFSDYDFEACMSYKYLEFVEAEIGVKKLLSTLETQVHGRRYFCPACKDILDGKFEPLDSKWAFLQPNTPKSDVVFCINCDQQFKVNRAPCKLAPCVGNVIYEGGIYAEICLTCYNPLSNE